MSGIADAARISAAAPRKKRGWLPAMWRSRNGRALIITAIILVVIVLLIAGAPLFTSFDPSRADPLNRLLPPSQEHLLGTDRLGRDVFTRVFYGGQPSLIVGLLVAVITTVIGGIIGLLAAFTRFDNAIMRVMDGFMAFPAIILALGLIAALGSSLTNVVVALSIVYVPRVARVMRGAALIPKAAVYTEAARGLGASLPRIIFRHALPNCVAPAIVQATFIVAHAIQIEATLSFLGVGMPPSIASWGNILQESRQVLRQAPWIGVSAGLAVMFTVLTLNVLGDALRDYLDPKLRGAGDR